MSLWLTLLIEISVGIVCGYILQKLHVPGGMLIGAIIGVAFLNIGYGIGHAPKYFKMTAQICTGAYLGCTMSRDEIKEIPNVLKPALLSVTGFFCLCLSCAYCFERFAGIDTLTSLFCALPGGITDTPLVALDMGASVGIVVAAQLVRAIFGLSALPAIVLLADKVMAPRLGVPSVREKDEIKKKRPKPENAMRMMLLTLLVAAVGGVIGKRIGIPAGTFTFSLIAAMIFNIKTNKGYSPLILRRLAQVLSGICMGVRFTVTELSMMRRMVVPLLCLMLGYTVLCVLLGTVFAKYFNMGLREAMLSMSPAGATEVTLIAADMDVVSSKLLVMHLFRLITALVVFPQLFPFYLKLRGLA